MDAHATPPHGARRTPTRPLPAPPVGAIPLFRVGVPVRWPFWLLVWASIAVCSMATAAEDEDRESPLPLTVDVAVDLAYLRAGPGDDFYPTERLTSGSRVEIWAIDAAGWCAVRPVAGSFSWLRAADVDEEMLSEQESPPRARNGAPRIGVVVADGAVARVGSQINALRHVAQVRLEAGERVRVLERVRIEKGRHAGLWLRVEPPAGEFRWARLADLESSPGLRLAALGAGFVPQSPVVEPIERPDTADAIASFRAAGEAIALAANEATASAEPLPASDPRPLGAVPQAKRMLAGWLPKGTGVFEAPPPAAVAAPQASTADELTDIDLALSVAVAGPSDSWNLPQLRERLRLAATRTASTPERLRADAIDARIARFETILAKQQALAAGPPTDSSPLRLGTMWSSLGGVGSRPIRPGVLPGGTSADGRPDWTPPDVSETTGRLATVVSRRPDAPRWALVDGNNNVVVFVNPQPGVNLAPLVGQQVSVRGARGYMPEYTRPYLVATEARPRVAQAPPSAQGDLTR